MSQAKTQMPNKSFGLNTNTSVQSADDNNWSNEGLGHFRVTNNNSNDSSMNWSSSGTALTATKLSSANSSNSNGSDLWSTDNHNSFNQNIDDLLKNDKNNKISSNSQYHQSANHSQFLKSQNTTSTNKWNSSSPVNSSLSYNGGNVTDQHQHQQQHLRNQNNQFGPSNGLGNQSIDLISSSTWSPFSSNPIGSQQPNRPPSSASTTSSTNNSEIASHHANQNSFPNHSHSSNSASTNYAQQQHGSHQWSQQQQQQHHQNGWSNGSESSDFNSTDWQPQTMSHSIQQNNSQNSPVPSSSSATTTVTSSSTHASSTITNIVRGGTGSLAPPPAVPAPPAPTTSASQAAASSAKSWAKIVSQQSSPSTPATTAPPTASTTLQSVANIPNTSNSLSNSAPTQPTQSSNSSQSLSHSANSQQFNNTFNGSKGVSGSSQSANSTSNKSSAEMNQEWNIKVNQSVPWDMENQLRLNNSMKLGQNVNSTQSSSASSSTSSTNANNQFSAQATSSNSTSSSPASNIVMPNQTGSVEALMINFNQAQQNNKANNANFQQSQKVDTGTDIWLSNNNNNSQANKPKSNWENSQPINMGASGNSSNSQSSSSSPITAMNHSGNSNWTVASGQQQQGSNAQWNSGQRWSSNQQPQQNENFAPGSGAGKASTDWNQSSSWMDNNSRANPSQQPNKPLGNSSTSSTSSGSSQQQQQMPLNETTNQVSRWNQQTPPPYSAPLGLAGNGSENQPITSISNATLVCQAANLKLAIEPQGWEDPDFKLAKKSDDGTNIWGDPEHQRLVKVTKWMHVTRHMPNKQAAAVSQQQLAGGVGEQENQMGQNQTFAANVQSGSLPSGSSQQWSSSDQGSSSQSANILQQSMSASSWSNTPAAPLSLSSNNESLNQTDSPINSALNEWTQDLVDTKSWSSFKDTKNNFDPSVGIIDTSKWQASNGNQMPQPPTVNGQFMPIQSGINGNMNGIKMANSNTDWSDATSPFNGNRDDMMKQPLSRSVNGMTNANMTNNSMINSIGRIPNMNSSGSNSNINQQLLNNQQMQHQNKNNLNLNLIQNQNMMQQQQNSSIGSPQNLIGSTNANSNLNNMIMNNSGNMNSSSSNQTLNPSPQPQVQHQLVESFRLAVSSGLISPDLLNTKLPQDVLALLYQLFQTLTNYIATNNKLTDLNKRRGQMLPAQFKAETDLLTMDAQSMKSTLVTLQTKIHAAHQILKQSGNSNNSTGGNKQSGSPLTPGLSTPPANSVELAAAAAGVPLNDLPILKDHSNTQMNNLNAHQQRSKLLQLLNESSNESTKGFSRQVSHQPVAINQQHNKYQSQFSQPANFLGNNSSMSSQWSNFDAAAGMMSMGNGQVDDRITPFIPGQLWAGSQSSIEDDPNCTPGSVSKPLLTETIDPEIILNGLQRGSHWSNFSDNLLNNNLGNMGMIGNNRSNNNSNCRTNSSNLNGSSNPNSQNWGMGNSSNSNGINGGSIGEQLWGVGSRSASRAGNTANIPISQANNAANMTGSMSGRNSNSFGANNNQMINQQQFFRNNVNNGSNWNAQQANGQMNNQSVNSSNNQNISINSGNYILIRNVPAHVDQATLKALCSQHASGQLTYYRYIQQMTCVIVRYNTKEEANNAQNKLNSVSLGNTTIFTQPLNENDLKFLFSM